MQPSTLVLRDIHQPPAPPWWPPAPGWWIVIAALLLLSVGAAVWQRRRRQRRTAIERAFEDEVAAAGTAAARVATVSALLRRAARQRDPTADRLQGDAWLRFLDGAPSPRKSEASASSTSAPSNAAPFSNGPGRVLLDGGFRRDVADGEVEALLPIARRRYRQLMGLRD